MRIDRRASYPPHARVARWPTTARNSITPTPAIQPVPAALRATEMSRRRWLCAPRTEASSCAISGKHCVPASHRGVRFLRSPVSRPTARACDEIARVVLDRRWRANTHGLSTGGHRSRPRDVERTVRGRHAHPDAARPLADVTMIASPGRPAAHRALAAQPARGDRQSRLQITSRLPIMVCIREFRPERRTATGSPGSLRRQNLFTPSIPTRIAVDLERDAGLRHLRRRM